MNTVVRRHYAYGESHQNQTAHVAILSDELKTVMGTPVGTPQTAEQFLAGEEAADLSRYDTAFAGCRRSVFQRLQDYLDKQEGEFIEWTP